VGLVAAGNLGEISAAGNQIILPCFLFGQWSREILAKTFSVNRNVSASLPMVIVHHKSYFFPRSTSRIPTTIFAFCRSRRGICGGWGAKNESEISDIAHCIGQYGVGIGFVTYDCKFKLIFPFFYLKYALPILIYAPFLYSQLCLEIHPFRGENCFLKIMSFCFCSFFVDFMDFY